MNNQFIDDHDFYCINCGNKGIPVIRKKSKQKEHFHRKKLYCPYCKREYNFIEVRNAQEKEEFKRAFEAGEFKEEALKDIV